MDAVESRCGRQPLVKHMWVGMETSDVAYQYIPRTSHPPPTVTGQAPPEAALPRQCGRLRLPDHRDQRRDHRCFPHHPSPVSSTLLAAVAHWMRLKTQARQTTKSIHPPLTQPRTYIWRSGPPIHYPLNLPCKHIYRPNSGGAWFASFGRKNNSGTKLFGISGYSSRLFECLCVRVCVCWNVSVSVSVWAWVSKGMVRYHKEHTLPMCCVSVC